MMTVTLFAFMAGEYPYWLLHTRRKVEQPQNHVGAGPNELMAWARIASHSGSWRNFSAFYLVRNIFWLSCMPDTVA
jgi:hypothetical protein